MASDSDAVSWLRLGGRFVFDTHCVRGRTGSSRAFGFNTNWRMPVRPTASMWLSPAWTLATSNSTPRSTTNQSPDMTLSPPPRAEVYLVENRLNPISTRAALELTDDNLRCTVKEYSKWVEKALGISDLRSRLQAGEAVAAFDFRRDQLKITWLKQFLKAGFSVSEGRLAPLAGVPRLSHWNHGIGGGGGRLGRPQRMAACSASDLTRGPIIPWCSMTTNAQSWNGCARKTPNYGWTVHF